MTHPGRTPLMQCPHAPQDYDFGQAPMLITACKAGKAACKQLLAVGQKAGIVWALSPDTGAVDWWKQVRAGWLLVGGSILDGFGSALLGLALREDGFRVQGLLSTPL